VRELFPVLFDIIFHLGFLTHALCYMCGLEHCLCYVYLVPFGLDVKRVLLAINSCLRVEEEVCLELYGVG
jgi:hypothetical protein